ncbi:MULTISPECIES: metallophosphoesterase family protein [Methylocaldum]|jgi:putative phosphoesterase|uniref:metallophosphoesterase family protein n=2 Tax=Methylocaldum TaxID=73778 RepID=UPI00098B1033|nr:MULTISPECIES: metallophosphoesterase family protein [unclassified Methylocaldum]MDV3241779.1 metallophosphatase family protein [Methylocaldum sp.]MVF21886.1 metallophosphoesterase [Methylocaldum sp. BRCS4]
MRFIGVISDTHGLMRPEAITALGGCDLILHAGDIGRPEVLDTLRSIAPVVAVRGNVDKGAWAEPLPEREVVRIDGRCIYLLHNLKELNLNPAAAGFAAVVSGHSHQPKIRKEGGVCYLNPGSAGPRRFKLPVSIGRLVLSDGELCGEIVELDVY